MENNFDSIKIYPEWNVNKNKSIADNVPATLKSIQSGM